MDPDIIRIRRERWLQDKKKQTNSPSVTNVAARENKRSFSQYSCTSSLTSSLVGHVEESQPFRDKQQKKVEQKKKSSRILTTDAVEGKTNTNDVIEILSSDEEDDNVPSCSSFSICSYNLWFGPPYPKERMERIADIIICQEKRPVLIGFQEVTNYFQDILFPVLESVGYTILTCQDKNEVDYQCAIAVLTKNLPHKNSGEDDHEECSAIGKIVDSGFVPYSSTIMNRGLLWAHVYVHHSNDNSYNKINGNEKGMHILFTTTHLESFMGQMQYDGKEQRRAQIIQSSEFCKEYMLSWNDILNVVIMTGDLNWDDERKRSKGLDETLLPLISKTDDGSKNDWMDAWLETRKNITKKSKNDDGYTYDAKENPMLGGNLRRRFDRCLVQFAPKFPWKIGSSKLIGKEPIEGIKWNKEIVDFMSGRKTGKVKILPVLPSDHYGLHVSFQVETLTLKDEMKSNNES